MTVELGQKRGRPVNPAWAEALDFAKYRVPPGYGATWPRCPDPTCTGKGGACRFSNAVCRLKMGFRTIHSEDGSLTIRRERNAKP